ncbi:hypothetical protein M011DRAFT_486332 [Sporormia fimetaria CBS 119925]|uniref:Uncharacterized protein n=1 Tax=Sporormia fimetaria CBS 119925 TaxID=1340428 RepID=A0A6A6VE89_9PLEO|nr:hypothetical protein M011DRAFT_486332 [Sporormia fimetaria CBS 119925]
MNPTSDLNHMQSMANATPEDPSRGSPSCTHVSCQQEPPKPIQLDEWEYAFFEDYVGKDWTDQDRPPPGAIVPSKDGVWKRSPDAQSPPHEHQSPKQYQKKIRAGCDFVARASSLLGDVDALKSSMEAKKRLVVEKEAALEAKQALFTEREAAFGLKEWHLAGIEAALQTKQNLVMEKEAALEAEQALFATAQADWRRLRYGSLLEEEKASLEAKAALIAEGEATVAWYGRLVAEREAVLDAREALFAAREAALEAKGALLVESEAALEVLIQDAFQTVSKDREPSSDAEAASWLAKKEADLVQAETLVLGREGALKAAEALLAEKQAGFQPQGPSCAETDSQSTIEIHTSDSPTEEKHAYLRLEKPSYAETQEQGPVDVYMSGITTEERQANLQPPESSSGETEAPKSPMEVQFSSPIDYSGIDDAQMLDLGGSQLQIPNAI